MQTINKKGLTVKDLITVGIFSALFLVFALVGGIFFAPSAARCCADLCTC